MTQESGWLFPKTGYSTWPMGMPGAHSGWAVCGDTEGEGQGGFGGQDPREKTVHVSPNNASAIPCLSLLSFKLADPVRLCTSGVNSKVIDSSGQGSPESGGRGLRNGLPQGWG